MSHCSRTAMRRKAPQSCWHSSEGRSRSRLRREGSLNRSSTDRRGCSYLRGRQRRRGSRFWMCLLTTTPEVGCRCWRVLQRSNLIRRLRSEPWSSCDELHTSSVGGRGDDCARRACCPHRGRDLIVASTDAPGGGTDHRCAT